MPRGEGAKVRHPDLELKLEIFRMIADPGRRYTQEQIAAACGCSRATIYQIEKRALAKMRQAARAAANN